MTIEEVYEKRDEILPIEASAAGGREQFLASHTLQEAALRSPQTMETIWNVVQRDVPEVGRAIQAMLEDEL